MTICTRACALLALASCLGCTYYEVHGSCTDRPVDVCIGDCRTDRGDGGAPLSCVLDGDCEAGERCEDGRCVPSARCTADLECSPSEICDFRGTCAAPSGCRGDADCASAHLCVEGRCRAFDDVCRFDHDCGPARTCVNGACRSLCGADADCGIGSR
ncbi:MAG: hypothetical protein K8H88_07445, partial [Sandaracinaceae bacterium]|nr:hypothetical protein [Sandaracinaceae bacterium]